MSHRYYTHRHVITFDETNLVGNAYFASYVHWQGHCREMFLSEHTPGVVADLQEGRLALVTVSCSVEYYAECFALDAVEVRMSLGPCAGNRMTMTFDYVRGGLLVARGQQCVACMAPESGRTVPVAVPRELETALQPYR